MLLPGLSTVRACSQPGVLQHSSGRVLRAGAALRGLGLGGGARRGAALRAAAAGRGRQERGRAGRPLHARGLHVRVPARRRDGLPCSLTFYHYPSMPLSVHFKRLPVAVIIIELKNQVCRMGANVRFV